MQKISLLEIGIEFGLIIAIPLIAFIAFGFYLDKTFQTVPVFILAGMFLALFISAYILYQKIKQILSVQ